MLIQLDHELFPNDCEVVEIPEFKQYVYLIQKNASTSLRRQATENQDNIYINSDIKELKFVDLYIRDPLERYLSGINTYLQHLKRDNSELDSDTCLWFATRYNFLNRHYMPQILWVINLSRYLADDTILRFRKFNEVKNLTSYNIKAGITPADQKFEQKVKQMMQSDLELYLFLDQMLLDFSGQEFTFNTLKHKLQTHPSDCYTSVIERFVEIAKKITLS